MAKRTSKWTDHIYSPISVLNHAQGLHLERFTSEDLDHIAGCDDVPELKLGNSKMAEPVDLARIAHITNLTTLRLEKLKFTNLAALRALPHLTTLSIENCRFSDFDALNGFQTLTRLYLRRNKLKAFPAGLDLPQLQALYLSNNGISDLGFVQKFVQNYPHLESLDLSSNQLSDLSSLGACPQIVDLNLSFNQITDLSPLVACPQVVKLNVAYNPLTGLAPLAGRKFSDFHASAPQLQERLALKLDLPPTPPTSQESSAESIEARRVANLMQAKDWPAFYAITDLALLARGFAYLMNQHFDAETLRGALAHPAEGAFHAMVAKGLRPHYGGEADLLVTVLCGFGERTIAPMMECFHTALARHSYRYAFYAGKMELEHEIILCVLTGVASPAYTDLFLAFLNEREGFSENYLYLYKRLLDVVGKTKSAQLVEPVMDLLRFEQKIIGGDPAFMKKIFKAIGQLGSKADAAVLASRFNAAAEERPDVLQAYEATLARLEKKKA